MNEVIYPIILTYEDNCIQVSIPNFSDDYMTFGENLKEALESAKEVITLELYNLLENKEVFPEPLDIKQLKTNLDIDQEIMYLTLWLPYELSKVKTVYKKKTLSIPTWLDMLATNKNLNFSQILQKALKEELGF